MNRAMDAKSDLATEPTRTSTTRRRVGQVREGLVRVREDALAVEEPLEIRLYPGDDLSYLQVAVTMRTPGHDFQLAAGFLFTEGILTSAFQVGAIVHCEEEGEDRRGNVVNVLTDPGAPPPDEGWQRRFYVSSSCGICGRSSIDAVRQAASSLNDPSQFDPEVLYALPDLLRSSQGIFCETGALHA